MSEDKKLAKSIETSQRDAILIAIKKYCPQKRVLDLGCGDFFYSKKALEAGAKKPIFAIDKLLQQPIKDVYYSICDAQHTNFNARKVEVILFLGVLSYVNIDKIIKELDRILTEDGVIIMTIKDSRGLKHRLHDWKVKMKLSKRLDTVQDYFEVKRKFGEKFEIIYEENTKPIHNTFFILRRK
jgi:ubiquinone/menaquinone biosynthesis C-methylase UbiE